MRPKLLLVTKIRYACEVLQVHEVLVALTDLMNPVTLCVESCADR